MTRRVAAREAGVGRIEYRKRNAEEKYSARVAYEMKKGKKWRRVKRKTERRRKKRRRRRGRGRGGTRAA